MSNGGAVPGSQLSPWDQAPYWQPVKETKFTNIGINIPVVGADMTRIALIFCAGGTGTVDVSTKQSVNVGDGMRLTNGGPHEHITNDSYGPLTTVAWYAALNGAAPTLTVIEIFLAKWPGE